MAGILDQQMAPEAEDEMTEDEGQAHEAAEPPAEEGSENAMSPQAIEAKLALPGPLKEQLDKIVVAGLKIMFDEKTHQLMLTELDKPGPIEQRLAEGITGLVALLFEQSQRSIPPQLLIPAGLMLLAYAVQFLEKSGEEVTPKQFAAALKLMIEAILRMGQVDPDKLKAHLSKGTTAAPAEQPMPAAPGGLVAQAQEA
jgi:hypothetical protein